MIANSRPVPKQAAMALKSGLAERCFAVSARWRPKPSMMRTVCSSAAMRAGMVRAGTVSPADPVGDRRVRQDREWRPRHGCIPRVIAD